MGQPKTSFVDNTTDYVVSIEQDGSGTTLELLHKGGNAASPLLTAYRLTFGQRVQVVSVDSGGSANFQGNLTATHGQFGGINSDSNYQIQGLPVVSANDGNLFLGFNAGNGTSDQATGNTLCGSNAGGGGSGSGSGNCCFGAGAGSQGGGNRNCYFGWKAGVNVSGDDNIYIGYDIGANVSGNNESHAIRIGNPISAIKSDSYQSAIYLAGISTINPSAVPVLYDHKTGQLFAQGPSSIRFKEQVQDMGESSNELMRLRPVTFSYRPQYCKSQASTSTQFGLVAEEVAEVCPELVVRDDDGSPYAVQYQHLIPMLLNEMQKLHRRIEAQGERLAALEQKIVELR